MMGILVQVSNLVIKLYISGKNTITNNTYNTNKTTSNTTSNTNM